MKGEKLSFKHLLLILLVVNFFLLPMIGQKPIIDFSSPENKTESIGNSATEKTVDSDEATLTNPFLIILLVVFIGLVAGVLLFFYLKSKTMTHAKK